jgi:RNA polymerase sigma-70 factor (ECF subfamily)
VGENGVPSPDDELVRRARGGDQEAARVLFERYEDVLRRRVRRRLPAVVRRRVGDSDVLQEAFLVAFRRLKEFEARDPDSLRKWLDRIVEHKVRDEIRRYLGTKKRSVRREVGLSAVSPVSEPKDQAPSPGSEAAAAEERVRVLREIDAMDAADREILRLVHAQGLAFREAGERLGIAPDAARMRHTRALARLTARLSRGGPP